MATKPVVKTAKPVTKPVVKVAPKPAQTRQQASNAQRDSMVDEYKNQQQSPALTTPSSSPLTATPDPLTVTPAPSMGEHSGSFNPVGTVNGVTTGTGVNQTNDNVPSPDQTANLVQADNFNTAGDGVTGKGATPTGNPDQSAISLLLDGLQGLGLGAGLQDLITKAWGLSKNGFDSNYIMNDKTNGIRHQPAYLARFPAMAGMNASGNGMSEASYLAKETKDRELIYTYLGPTAKNYDNFAQLGTLMTDFVSPLELQGRLQAIHDEANASPEAKAWLKSTYGMSDQDVAAAWLDPKLASDTVNLRDTAGQIGGAGVASGFGNLTQAQAEMLATQGVTQNQAQNTFAKIGAYGQLEQNLPGNDSGSLTQQQLIDGAFNGGAAGAKIAQEQALRLGQFQDGGGMAATSGGVEGLKNANTL